MPKRKMPEKESYPKGEFAFVDKVTSVNHRPHPYVIGAKHVAWASDRWGGVLGDRQIEDAEKHGIRCAARGCDLGYREHKSDFVAFVKLTRDCTSLEMSEWLKNSCVEWAEGHGIDGFAFVETGFRIKNVEVKDD